MGNKKKIINDPVYGFIHIPFESCYDIIQHPWFQRLRRIRQLGTTEFVYPGATHTRFHHALGAMHLVIQAIENLRAKGIEISDAEFESTCHAILLHDIGHGPFSHALEKTIIRGVSHEQISLLFMQALDQQFGGSLKPAIDIFQGHHPRQFLHELISSQLDMDRLDYLARDSFYTGVSEGIVGSERLLNMLNVKNNRLLVEEKGIYSVEKFIIARRLMYWQVYLHKTVVAADNLLLNVLQRAWNLWESGKQPECTPYLKYFFMNKVGQLTVADLEAFSRLDDVDIWASVKMWSNSSDRILAELSRRLINRVLPKILINNMPYSPEVVREYEAKARAAFDLKPGEETYFVNSGILENSAYLSEGPGITILRKDGSFTDVTEASDNYNLSPLRKTVKKYFLSWVEA